MVLPARLGRCALLGGALLAGREGTVTLGKRPFELVDAPGRDGCVVVVTTLQVGKLPGVGGNTLGEHLLVSAGGRLGRRFGCCVRRRARRGLDRRGVGSLTLREVLGDTVLLRGDFTRVCLRLGDTCLELGGEGELDLLESLSRRRGRLHVRAISLGDLLFVGALSLCDLGRPGAISVASSRAWSSAAAARASRSEASTRSAGLETLRACGQRFCVPLGESGDRFGVRGGAFCELGFVSTVALLGGVRVCAVTLGELVLPLLSLAREVACVRLCIGDTLAVTLSEIARVAGCIGFELFTASSFAFFECVDVCALAARERLGMGGLGCGERRSVRLRRKRVRHALHRGP